jgi:S1 RNA binding domain protein
MEIDWEQESRKNQGNSFEDRMSKFLKESDEKLQQLKKNTDSKRNGGYRKSEGGGAPKN